MTKQPGSPKIRPSSTEESSSARLAAKIAAGDAAARRDQERIRIWEKLAEFLDTLPPSAIGSLLNTIPVELVDAFLRRVPELHDGLISWGDDYFNSLKRPDIEAEVRRLEALGVRRETTALGMRFVGCSPVFDNTFAQLGDKRERERQARRLRGPIAELELLSNFFGELRGFGYEDIPNPRKIVAELRLLSSLFSWGEFVYDSLGANHLLEVSKFGLASLVRETTGNFLDREVGKLVNAALKRHDYDYDETAYRVWRNTNYVRLTNSMPIVTRVFIALNSLHRSEEERSSSDKSSPSTT